MINIHSATSDDVKAITPLFMAYLHFYQINIHTEESVCQFLNARLIKKEAIIFIAKEGDALVGFLQLYPSFSSLQLKGIWIVNDLFVVESARKRGIGKQLLSAANTLAHETESAYLTLSTSLENAPAQRLYESLNWQRNNAFITYIRNLTS